VIEPSLDTIVERLQLCIVDARALQLKMLELVLSIALLEAHESKAKLNDAQDDPDA
jgi:hypothetical protein